MQASSLAAHTVACGHVVLWSDVIVPTSKLCDGAMHLMVKRPAFLTACHMSKRGIHGRLSVSRFQYAGCEQIRRSHAVHMHTA